jgi:DNA modification methylase
MNKIFNEDCLKTLDRNLEYDYLFFSPPDYNEIGLEPVKDDDKYFGWLKDIFSKFNPRKNVVTIVTSNRRYKRKTIAKHSHITEVMKNLGYDLLNEKIWEKSKKINMFRYNYAVILCFGKDKFKSKNTKMFKYDTWFHPHHSYKGYTYNMAQEVVERCIENYTEEGDVVYDPFMGIGTTALACLKLKRNYLGSEINKETYELGISKINNYKNNFENNKWVK